MATIARFEDLEVWQVAQTLCRDVYQLVGAGKFARDFALRDQIVRAANSISLNIAEGFARRTNREFRQFLYIAHGSAAEVQACLYIARDQQYVTSEQFQKSYATADRISRMAAGFIRYLNTKPDHPASPTSSHRNPQNP